MTTSSVQLEPLLQNRHNKYTIFPIEYQDIWNYYTIHFKAIWFVDDIDITKDLNDWKKLTNDEKYFIKHVLAFFAASDGIIMENLSTNFCTEVQVAEARAFYSMQMFSENIHSIMYSRLIETYVTNRDEKNVLFNAIETMPAVTRKAEWAKKWIDCNSGFATRLIAFIIVEGLFFSGAFCSIYWIGEKGIMPGLTNSNAYIARDESLHVEFGTLLYNKYVVNKLTQLEITDIITEAVEIEKSFIIDALPCALLGMNATMMSTYIEFVADRLVSKLGYESPFKGVKCPFGFMDKICLQNQTSFFDGRPTEYQKTMNESADSFSKIDFDADF